MGRAEPGGTMLRNRPQCRLAYFVSAVCAAGLALAVTRQARADDAPPDSVWVHVSTKNARLVHGEPDGSWAPVCDAPCDQWVSRSARYALEATDGEDFARGEFEFDPKQGRAVAVRAKDRGTAGGGVTLIVIGGLALAIGSLVLLADESIPGNDHSPNLPGTVAAIVLGAAGVAGGIVLVASNGTSISQRPVNNVPDPNAAAVTVRAAPTWRDATPLEAATPAPPIVLQLLTVRF